MDIDPATLGHWEGDTFIFDEPFDMGEGHVARSVVLGPDALMPGVSRDDAIYVFINGVQDPLGPADVADLN